MAVKLLEFVLDLLKKYKSNIPHLLAEVLYCRTHWQVDGETVADFTFWGFQITADVNCSHEMKRHLLLGRKAVINLVSVLKSRDITLPTKVHIVKAMVFPVVRYRCES